MNNNDLNALTNDLMTAFLDNSPSSIVGGICEKYHIEVGGKVFNIASNRVIDWLENKEYELLSKTNQDKLTQQGLKQRATIVREEARTELHPSPTDFF